MKKIIVCLLVLLSLAVPVVAGEICVDLQTGNNTTERVFLLDAQVAQDQYFTVIGKYKEQYPAFGIGFFTDDQVITVVNTQEGTNPSGNMSYRVEINLDNLDGRYRYLELNKESAFGQAQLVTCTSPLTVFDKSTEFVDNGDGTVYQNTSDLVWQKVHYDHVAETGEAYNWYSSSDYCSRLNLAEKVNWRIPTRSELESLVDMSQTDVKIVPIFEGTPATWFWSSTEHFARTDATTAYTVWTVNFKDGLSSIIGKQNTPPLIRCVHD